MKNITKTRLHVLFLAAMLLPPSLAGGQQTYQWMYNDDFSLIRTIDESSYMVYSADGARKNFYLITNTGWFQYFKTIVDDNLIINDFEIFKDTVYFCGHYALDGFPARAVLGYFPLENFPFGEIRYDDKNGLLTFHKLDMYSKDGQTHAVMTGIDETRYSTIVDAFHASDTTWFYNIANGKDLNVYFDDVAVVKSGSNSYVVFSSREKPDGFTSVFSRVWSFGFPPGVNMPVFSNPYIYFQLNVPPLSPVLVESMDGWFASAYKIADDTLLVNRYAPTSYDRSAKIRSNSALTLKDIQYNSYFAFALDLLVTETTPTTVNSYIYNAQEYCFDTNLAIMSHFYKDEDLNSLALVSMLDYKYIASGHDSPYLYLRTYRYNYTNWNCSEKRYNTPKNHKYVYYPGSGEIYYKTKKCPFDTLKYIPNATTIETICGGQNNMEL